MARDIRVKYLLWTHFECSNCGCVYRYQKEGQPYAVGRDIDRALADVRVELETRMPLSIHCSPCPECSNGPRLPRESAPVTLHLFAAGCYFLATLAAWQASMLFRSEGPFWLLVCLSPFTLLMHFLAIRSKPDARLERNKSIANDGLAGGWVEILKPGNGSAPPRSSPHRVLVWFSFGIIVFAFVLTWAAPVITLTHVQNESTMPTVVGPGDKVRVVLPDKVRAVQDLWSGKITSFEVLNRDELGSGEVEVSTGTAWRGQYDRLLNAGFETNLWVELAIPDDPAYANKTIRARVKMDVQYPTRMDDKQFTTASKSIDREFEVRLSDRAVGKAQRVAFKLGTLLAPVLWVSAGLSLYIFSRLRNRLQRPSRVELISIEPV